MPYFVRLGAILPNLIIPLPLTKDFLKVFALSDNFSIKLEERTAEDSPSRHTGFSVHSPPDNYEARPTRAKPVFHQHAFYNPNRTNTIVITRELNYPTTETLELINYFLLNVVIKKFISPSRSHYWWYKYSRKEQHSGIRTADLVGMCRAGIL